MWLYRRRWKDLDETQQAALDELFQQLPILGEIYHRRETLSNIFDDRLDRAAAGQKIIAWIEEAEASGEDWSAFIGCLRRHWDGILAYFDERKTSGVVEGLNNKARVVLKRCFGLKSIETFWTRLIVEAGNLLDDCQRSVADLRKIAHAIQARFCLDYT